MFHICGVSKMFGEWYQITNKTEDTNKLTSLAFKIIIILHNRRLATYIKLLEAVSKGLFRNLSQNSCHMFLNCRHAAAIQERVTAVGSAESECAVAVELNENLFFSCCPIKLSRKVRMMKESRVS
jgi:hypothetical protein